MRITYYALRPVQVGDELREPGDLIPEAAEWPFLSGYVADGKVAPVLVVTLPEDVQMMLLEWEEAQASDTTAPEAPAEETEDDEEESEDDTEDDATEKPVARRGRRANAKEKVA